MTLAQLRTSVARKLGLTNESGHDERTALNEWANSAVLDILARTRCHIESGNVNLTVGASDYTLDSDMISVVGVAPVESDGTTSLFEPVTFQEMLDLRHTSSSSVVRRYCVIGDMLMVYPTPSSADTLTYYYVPRPTEMSDDAHDPSATTYGGIPRQYHKAIECYMLWQAAEFVSDPNSGSGQKYRQDYLQEIASIRTALVRTRGRLPRARLGAGLSQVNRDPSVYP